MFRRAAVPIARAMLAAALLVTMGASRAHAQAFVPAKGEGSVSFLYQDQFFRYHYFPTQPVDAGHIWARSMLYDITYGLTDKIAVSFGIPLMVTRYVGPTPHFLASDPSKTTPIDDGTWHATIQDLRFDVRYNVTRDLWNRGIVVTPFVGSVMPSHEYPYFAHAGFGRNLQEIQTGVSVAKIFERGIPGLLLQGRYAYGFVEEVVDIPHNRSLASLEAAYFVTSSFRAFGMIGGQRTHGGIDLFGARSRLELPPDVFVHHDQIQRENMLTVGGGASYSLNDSVDLFGSLTHTVAQRNGHELERGISIGLSWSFTTRLAQPRAVTTTAENSLVRCLCEKGTK
jgi:hypothetical protein